MRRHLRLRRLWAALFGLVVAEIVISAVVAGQLRWLVLLAPSAAYFMATRPKRAPAPAPIAPAEPVRSVREARYPDPGDLPRQKGKTCRICGMSDPERFRLKIGVSQYRGWPAHDSCVEWLDGGKPAKQAVPRAAEPRMATSRDPWEIVRPEARAQLGRAFAPFTAIVPPAPPPGVPKELFSLFPQVTAENIASARMIQRHGAAALVTSVRAGTAMLCVLGMPDTPDWVRIGAECFGVVRCDPPQGGFTLIILDGTLRFAYVSGTPVLSGLTG